MNNGERSDINFASPWNDENSRSSRLEVSKDFVLPYNRFYLLPPSKPTPIKLPKKASRYNYPPSSCLALVVDNVLSPSDCEKLIEIATASNNNFQYIKEATHKAPDGSCYTVQIQNPNPHKLAFVDTKHSPNLQFSSEMDYPTLLMGYLYNAISEALFSSQSQQQPNFGQFVSRKKCGMPKGLNPRMRILKYDANDNDRFEPHFDATTYFSPVIDSVVPLNNQQQQRLGNKSKLKSLITVLVYLNNGGGEDFDGGETLYLDYDNYSTTPPSLASAGSHVERVIPKVGRIVLFEHDLFHAGAPLNRGTKYVMRTDILFEEDRDEERSKEIEKRDQRPATQLMLLCDVCEEIKLSTKGVKIMEEMGLFHISCESFISPGITCLKLMLIDGGMEESEVNDLIRIAFNSATIK